MGVEGGTGGVVGRGWKTAHTAYHSTAFVRVALPFWGPAALHVMSSSKADPLDVCARRVYGMPWLLPGVTEPGRASVTKAANTSLPAPTAGVAPLSTTLPSLPCAAAISSSEPARATPEYSATVPCRYAIAEADTVMVMPLGAAWLFS